MVAGCRAILKFDGGAMTSIDCEMIWESVRGDMQHYGPTHWHHRRIFSQLLSEIQRGEIAIVADIDCCDGSKWVFPFFSPICRNLFDRPTVESFSHGQFGFSKKLEGNVLYSVFLLNSMRKGDIAFVLTIKN